MRVRTETSHPTAWQTLGLQGAELSLHPDWCPEPGASALCEALLSNIDWEQHHVQMFGRRIAAPRLSCWVGDPGAHYRYSGMRFAPRPWPAALLPLRERLHEDIGVDFNSVLANLYRDGRDAMGWHSDDEPELGATPVIASLSLGAVRRFVLKRRAGKGHELCPQTTLSLDLPSGSLLLMRGETQRYYRHALPRTAKPLGPRINLTFRRILA